MKERIMKKSTKFYWDFLLNKFTTEYIENMMNIEDYAIGYGNNNKSFCYLVEVGTKELGDIRGSNSSKFGLWYGTHQDDKIKKLRTIKKYKYDTNYAFECIKKSLVKLIRETQELTTFKDLKSELSSMFKYKIMYLYNKEIMLPSFVYEDLVHFQDCLQLVTSKTFEEAQLSLLAYKREHFPLISNHSFMVNLYSIYGKHNVKITNKANEAADDRLNRKLIKFKEPQETYITKPVDKIKTLKKNNGSEYYPRDPKMSAHALKKAEYCCELDHTHKCFIKRSNNKPYTEVHHLIPLCYHYKFEKSLDVPENIVSLCSNCHKEIHFGKDADMLIKKLYIERKGLLEQAGIVITIDELLKMYHDI